MSEEVKLFRTWSSPYALRIVWALELKGVKYDTVFEDITNKSDLLLQYNPVYKKVPVLLHHGRPIAESLVILEYVEETWKQNALLPQDPYERALARFWAKFGEDKVMPSIWSVFIKDGKEQEAAKAEATENLKKLEEVLRGKKFFGGENIGYLDIALGWLANLIDVLEDITGLEVIESEKLPLLKKWMKEFYNAPVIKESWPPHDKLVIKFRAHREHYKPAPKAE